MTTTRTPKRFVGLHAHSCFSTYDGLGYPRDHIDFVIENGMDAWALTDHGNMNGYSHAQVYVDRLLREGRDFKFIPGVEFYLHPDLQRWRLDFERSRAEAKQQTMDDDGDVGIVVEDEDTSKRSLMDAVKRRHHLVVLARDEVGLRNLFALVSRSYIDGFYRYPRIDYSMLREHGEGLVVSTACLAGPMSYEVIRAYPDVDWTQLVPGVVEDRSLDIIPALEDVLDNLTYCVGAENVFLELQFNRLPAQHLVNRYLIELSRRTNIPLIVTADSHYPRPEMWKDRELYKRLGWLGTRNDALPETIDDLSAQLYPKNAEQVWESYRDAVRFITDSYPGADLGFYDDDLVVDAVERTYDIAHDIIADPRPDRSVKLPRSVVDDADDDEAFRVLAERVKRGLVERGLADKPEYVERAVEELKVIRDKKFALYFIVMAEVIELARRHMLVGPGRGSGAGSLVNYVLGITQVDPIKYNLLFARFLSNARQELPDVDSDVSDNDTLKEILKRHFGELNVIPISNFNTLKLKSLVKDVSKFYGIPFNEVNVATKGLESEVMKATMKKGDDKNVFVLKYDDAVKHSEKFRRFIEKYPHVGRHVETLFAQNKSIGRHAGGVIIADDVANNMPLIKVRGDIQTPWSEGLNYRHLSEFGWVKFDLLGLKTLRIIELAIAHILDRQRGGRYKVVIDGVEHLMWGVDEVILADGTRRRVVELRPGDEVASIVTRDETVVGCSREG